MHKLGGPSIHQCAKQRPHGGAARRWEGKVLVVPRGKMLLEEGGEVVGCRKGNVHERCTARPDRSSSPPGLHLGPHCRQQCAVPPAPPQRQAAAPPPAPQVPAAPPCAEPVEARAAAPATAGPIAANANRSMEMVASAAAAAGPLPPPWRRAIGIIASQPAELGCSLDLAARRKEAATMASKVRRAPIGLPGCPAAQPWLEFYPALVAG